MFFFQIGALLLSSAVFAKEAEKTKKSSKRGIDGLGDFGGGDLGGHGGFGGGIGGGYGGAGGKCLTKKLYKYFSTAVILCISLQVSEKIHFKAFFKTRIEHISFMYFLYQGVTS